MDDPQLRQDCLAYVAKAGEGSGAEIRGHLIVRGHHFLGKDDRVLTDGSPSDDLIFALIIVLYEEGPRVLVAL
jgi:hypothetical protein